MISRSFALRSPKDSWCLAPFTCLLATCMSSLEIGFLKSSANFLIRLFDFFFFFATELLDFLIYFGY